MVLRNLPDDILFPVTDALIKGGISLVEVPFDSTGAVTDDDTCRMIKALSVKYDGVLTVGAGTVLSARQADIAKESGAGYIVSPCVSEEVISETKKLGLVSIPGALTPTEIVTADKLGADFVKVFPAGVMGPGYFAAIAAPLGGIRLLAVGGIDAEDVPLYLSAGVKGFGISTKILRKEYVDNLDFEKITACARSYINACN